jgi:hypothetical protein
MTKYPRKSGFMKWKFPWKRIVVSLVGLLVVYGGLGLLLRKTGFLHPYWGKYLLLGLPGENGYSPVLARDPLVTRPLYALECLLLRDDFLHRDREIHGDLSPEEIENTFQRSFRQSVPRGLIVKSARFWDIQYLDIMKREIVARFLEGLQALADKDEEDDYKIRFSQEQVFNPRAVMEPGEPMEFEMSAPDFGCENSTDVTISADRSLLTVRWRISD